MEQIYQFCLDHITYWSITLFMAIESSFIPFPSEIVVPPAGYMAAKGDLNLALIFIFSTIGSLIGACINYFLSYHLGRPVIYKFANSKLGHICLLSQESIEKAEMFFNKNGAISTFIGRLIPGIRQLVSIPAGLSKMNFSKFAIFTTIGAGIWNIILCMIGYLLHSATENVNDIPELAKNYGTHISLGIIIVVAVICIILYFKNSHKKDNTRNV